MNELINMKSIAKELNNRTFTDYYYRLMLIARSVFKWENLPNNMNEKWIERYLFTQGQCVFFEDPIKGLMVAGVTENSPVNHYDEPTEVTPYATGYTGTSLTNGKECVIIQNNDESIPTSSTIQLYALKLANIDRTIDVNIMAQKIPIIIRCSDKQRLSLRNMIKQRNDNEPVLWVDTDFNMDSVDVLDVHAPVVFKDLELEKHMIWNEVMTLLGINNANMDKKERLVDDEVQANNEQVEASFNIMLKARERAAEQINKIFGTNIKVSRRIMSMPTLDDSEPPKASEGSEGGAK